MPEHALIVGGGIAGIRTAISLGKLVRERDMRITLCDRENSFVFNPLACAFRDSLRTPSGVSYIRIFEGTSIRFVQYAIDRIENAGDTLKAITSNGDHICAETIAICLGSQPRIGVIPGGKPYAFSAHTYHDALQLRYHIEGLYRRHSASSVRQRKHKLRVVVIGGGCSGVETAARIQIFLRSLIRRFRIDPSLACVELCEAREDILYELPKNARAEARSRLERLGVIVRTKCLVTRVNEKDVEVGSGGAIGTHTAVWAGGVRAHDVLLRSTLPVNPRCGAEVEETCYVRNTTHMFAAGSAAHIHPDTAMNAIREADTVAENIAGALLGRAPVLCQLNMTPHVPYPLVSGFHHQRALDFWALSSILPNMSAYRLWRKSW